MDWIAGSFVADTVQTMNHVTMSVEYAQVVVKTGIWSPIVINVKIIIRFVALGLLAD